MFNKKLITSILAVVVMLVMESQSALALATDPLSVTKASLDAVNAGNVDVAAATFADDADFTTPTGSFKGTDQIRRAIMADVANHVRIEATNFQVAGDKVTYSFKQSNDRLRGLGIDFINGNTEATIQNGKIMSLAGTLTPESRAAIQKAMAAAPQVMPNTGATDSPIAMLLLTLGSLGILVGAGVKVRQRL
jgi:hypothetical protein